MKRLVLVARTSNRVCGDTSALGPHARNWALGGTAARMAVNLRPDGRLARIFPNSTILRGQSSAGSIMRLLQLFRSRSARRSWRAFRE